MGSYNRLSICEFCGSFYGHKGECDCPVAAEMGEWKEYMACCDRLCPETGLCDGQEECDWLFCPEWESQDWLAEDEEDEDG